MKGGKCYKIMDEQAYLKTIKSTLTFENGSKDHHVMVLVVVPVGDI
jgi:hypothetical protein